MKVKAVFYDIDNNKEITQSLYPSKKIFEIHLARRKPNWKKTDINLNKLVNETEGKSSEPKFSGADIEAIVKTAVEMAFENDREICQADFEKAIKQTTPIADTLAEKIKQLQECLKKYQIQDASKSVE